MVDKSWRLKTCKVPNCNRLIGVKKTGLCHFHYNRLITHFDLNYVPIKDRPRRKCIVAGCDKIVRNRKRGFCRSHYSRWQTYGSPIYKPTRGPSYNQQTARNRTIRYLRAQGCSMQYIADLHNISRQRVHQILIRRYR